MIDPHTILSADEVKDLKEVFELFDEDRSGNIDMEELGCVAPVFAPFTHFSAPDSSSLCDACIKPDLSPAR